MEKYKIKQGDTLSKIARQYGISLSKLISNNSIQNPNLIQVGQTINIPERSSIFGNILKTVFAPALSGNILSTGLNNSTPTPDTINIGNLPETPVTPFRETATVLSYRDNPDGSRTNIMSDGSTTIVPATTTNNTVVNTNVPPGWDVVTYNNFKAANPTLEPTPEDTARMLGIEVGGDNSSTKSLLDEQTQLQGEIASLEESISKKGELRQSGYEEAGIFDDIKKLNELKDTLKVKIEERQKIRGLGATSTEFSQATTPLLEKNYLESAALSNIINVNIAAIDQQINDKYESDTFLLEQKNTRLDNIVKTYGDIITGEQASKLEVAKQNNAIELENLKMFNDITKSAATKAIEGGANPTDVANAVKSGDISSLYKLSGNIEVDNSQSVRTIDTIQSMLDNPKGLSGSVGPNLLSRSIVPGKNDTAFRADAKTIASQATLDYFIKLKADGATFGAMSDSEWDIISSASAVANLGIDQKTGKSNLGEEEFIKRLGVYQNVSRKAVTANALTKAGMDPTFMKGLDATTDAATIKTLYDKYVVPQAKASEVDYTQQDTGTGASFIQKEEGFSPVAYQDQGGTWTIGYGTTKINGVPVKPTDTITEDEAKRVALTQAATDYSTFADKLGDTVLTPNQFMALNSFEYNLGPGVWNQPTGQQILSSIQRGDLTTAQSLMQKFVNVKNPQTGQYQPSQGLITRRQREGKLLLS